MLIEITPKLRVTEYWQGWVLTRWRWGKSSLHFYTRSKRLLLRHIRERWPEDVHIAEAALANLPEEWQVPATEGDADAPEVRQEPADDLEEHQDRDEGRSATTPSRGDCPVEGGQERQG